MNDIPLNAHRNVPAKLALALQEAGSERELSRRLGVNILYISQLLKDGIEPTDQTEKGRAVRVKLFLPKRKQKVKDPKPVDEEVEKVKKAVRRMVRNVKHPEKYQEPSIPEQERLWNEIR